MSRRRALSPTLLSLLSVCALQLSTGARAAVDDIVTLDVRSVPAVDNAQAILKVKRPGMVHIAVDSAVGTTCTLVDHQRGPFASSGVPGTSSCNLDVLLDDGIYKLRLTSPPAKAGAAPPKPATITAVPFADVDVARRLDVGQQTTIALPDAHQLVRVLRLTRSERVHLTAVGQNVGDLRLWRDGAFIEPVSTSTRVVTGEPGRGRRRHDLEAVLDAGDYAVVLYGTDRAPFTQGRDDDTALLLNDAEVMGQGTAGGAEAVTIPAWGFLRRRVSVDGSTVSVVEVTSSGPLSDDVTLELWADDEDKAFGHSRRRVGSCVVEARGLTRACVLDDPSRTSKAVILEVRGPANTAVRLTVLPTGGKPASGRPVTVSGGVSGSPDLDARHASLVTAAVVPTHLDGAPLGCALERVNKGSVVDTVAWDIPHVGWTQAWKRRFNTDGTSTHFWLHLDKPGVYGISALGKRGASCEVFTLNHLGERTRIGEGSAPGGCDLKQALPEGPIEVRLYGGTPGIEIVRVGQVGLAALMGNDEESPHRSGCVFAVDNLSGTFRVRTNLTVDSGRRLIVSAVDQLREGSLAVSVDPGRSVGVVDTSPDASPDGGQALVALTAPGNAGVRCLRESGGATTTQPDCRLAAGAGGRLLLSTTSTVPSLAVFARQRASSTTTLPALSPSPPTLPIITPGKARFFTLDSGQQSATQSFLIDVVTAGLYDVQTTGLLATSCSIRTPTSGRLAEGKMNGRGRNCLLQIVLKPGRYRVDVSAVGTSRGRAGLQVVVREPRDLGPLALDDERFIEVEADVVARHDVVVRERGVQHLAVNAQRGTLSCRLDDDDGWPLLAVPHRCTLDTELQAGRYHLTVLPMTVRSRRALARGTPKVQAVLSGEVTHVLPLNAPRQALLGDDGHDHFRFTLAADVDVGFSLSPGLLGRLRPVTPSRGSGKKRQPEALGEIQHTIPPGDLPADVVDGGDCCDEDPGWEDGGEGGDDEGGGSDDGEDDVGGREEFRVRRYAPQSGGLSAAIPRPLPGLSGVVRSLTAGTWDLEVEHSRGDVGVSYTVQVGVRALMDNTTLAVNAPSVIEVLAPSTTQAGLMRIKTRGSTDVACRLLDAHGALLASSRSSGDDWNCALTAPLTPGSKATLFVDAEVLQPGPTVVQAAFLEGKSTGALKDGDRFRLVGKVATATVTPSADHIADVFFEATDGRFSCAAFDEAGRPLLREDDVTRCNLLLASGDGAQKEQPLTVMVWTADRPASVVAHVRERGWKNLNGGLAGLGGLGGQLGGDDVGVADAPEPGRYETAPNALCLPRGARGALLPCPVSFAVDVDDPRQVLLAVRRGERAKTSFEATPLAVRTRDVADLETARRHLGAATSVDRLQSPRPVLSLIDVRARPGSDAVPMCAVEDDGHRPSNAVMQAEDRCVAASRIGSSALLRTWTRRGADVDVDIGHVGVRVPSTTQPLPTGTVTLDGPARYALAGDSITRLDVALGQGGWAILLDDDSVPVDLCAPARDGVDTGGAGTLGALEGCRFDGVGARGGSLLVVPGGRQSPLRIDALQFTLPEAPPPVLTTVREVVPRTSGLERLQIAAAKTARRVWVEGPGVSDCWLVQADGQRRRGHPGACRFDVDAGQSASLVVEHSDRPWRAQLGPRDGLYRARLGALAPSSSAVSPLAVAESAVLRGTVARYRLSPAREGVARLRATGGVCAVVEVRSNELRPLAVEGLGSGCDVAVPVRRGGQYEAIVRGFGARPLQGTVSWTLDDVPTLGEGVGPESVALAGEPRLFRVPLEADGELGVGVQVDAEVLRCTLLNEHAEVLAEGCQLFGRYRKGTYLLRVENDPDGPPRRFRPVVFGLQGAAVDVPDAWLRDFFQRVPPPTTTNTAPAEVQP